MSSAAKNAKKADESRETATNMIEQFNEEDLKLINETMDKRKPGMLIKGLEAFTALLRNKD